MKIVENFVGELEILAAKNNEDWRYGILINPRSTLSFTFYCEETADGHTWLTGNGDTIENAVIHARANLYDSLRSFGYKV